MWSDLFLYAIPIACMSWTVTNEHIFRDMRLWLLSCHENPGLGFCWRKLAYLPTCEYCFSHWVTALFLATTHYHLQYDDWRGYVLAEFTLVWIANQYMTSYQFIRRVSKWFV